MNFRYRLMQFLSGRYGMDQLSFFIGVIALIIAFINLILNSIILQLFVNLSLGLVIFRMLSRNLEKRRRENYIFTEKINFIKRKRDFYIKKKNDKLHIYKKCPSCKAILRLPRKIGKHTTVCPKCGKEFKVKVRK